MTFALHQKDAIEFLKSLADNSIDSCVIDGPYGIGFMGKAWDGADIAKRHAQRTALEAHDPGDRAGHNGAYKSAAAAAAAGRYNRELEGMRAFQKFSEEWAIEALRVLKPGSYLLSFSSPRTYHRMVCGIEDAGFEIRDCILWLFGSGFPKSHNGDWGGTAVKPAYEPICMARKPLEGTVEENWKKWGTGALNIDGCRIELNGDYKCKANGRPSQTGLPDNYDPEVANQPDNAGRWPANLIHDGSDEVLQAFPDAPGQLADASTSTSTRKNQNVYGNMKRGNGRDGEASADSENEGGVGFKMKPGARREDSGSAARFFFSPKRSVSDETCQSSQCDATTVTVSSSLQNGLAYIAQNAAAIWESLAGIVSEDSAEPSTIVTPIESKLIETIAIQAILYIASGYSPECRLERHSPCGSHASVVAIRKQTGITTITTSLFRSGGCVDAATYSITPTNMDHGEAVSRFKYCPKASRSDRNAGCEHIPPKPLHWSSGDQNPGSFQSEGTDKTSPNNHPTVKPTDLMRYLCRLVTPPGGTVLDFYMGSGSTGRGAVLEGFHFIGNDREADYVEIARARIQHAVDFGDEYEPPKPKLEVPEAQSDLFGK